MRNDPRPLRRGAASRRRCAYARTAILAGMIACALSARAAEIVLDFSDVPVGQTPPGFRSTVAGKGLPGDWRVVLDDAPSAFAPLSSNAPVPAKRHVLAQLSQDPTDERFPILIYENETFGDFTLTTRFKLVGGKVEQMAGVAFRIQDENNFYVVRASGLGKTFRFYKVVNGVRGEPIGPEMEIPAGVWHELAIECKGNQIRCRLNGKEVIPPITDLSFTSGKVGFWTKSDSVSYFADTRISYVPREAPAQVMVREVLAKYTRLRGLRIYAPTGAPPELRIVASARESELGQPGGRAEHDVVERGTIYYQKTKNSVVVVMPLRDRNGDPVAAVWIEMESFPGQTQQSALARAQPILRQLQARVKDAADLIR